MKPIEPILKRSILVEEVTNKLRELIVKHSFAPGEKLLETKLSQQMCVGRNSIREAIRYLEKEGLVKTIPFKGAYVVTFSKKDIEEIYGLRLCLEEFAIKLIIENLNETKISKLTSIVTMMEKEINRSTNEELVDIDCLFHQTLCELSDNSRLTQIWNDMLTQLKTCVSLDYYQHSNKVEKREMLRSHYPLVTTIKSKDINSSLRIIREIILSGKKEAQEYLSNNLKCPDFTGDIKL